MFSLSNILLTILVLFIIFSFVIGILNMGEENTFFVPFPSYKWNEWTSLMEKINYIYVFICSWIVSLGVIALLFIFALWFNYGITHGTPEEERVYVYTEEELNRPKSKPRTKSICNWFGLAKNIIAEQEQQGYRYTGTSSGIICDEQLNFVRIE